MVNDLGDGGQQPRSGRVWMHAHIARWNDDDDDVKNGKRQYFSTFLFSSLLKFIIVLAKHKWAESKLADQEVLGFQRFRGPLNLNEGSAQEDGGRGRKINKAAALI